jgi:hypothetical protein
MSHYSAKFNETRRHNVLSLRSIVVDILWLKVLVVFIQSFLSGVDR